MAKKQKKEFKPAPTAPLTAKFIFSKKIEKQSLTAKKICAKTLKQHVVHK